VPVTPTTFRSDIRAGLKTILDGFRTANPTMLRGTSKTRPASIKDKPFAYVDLGSEDVAFVSGGRQREMSAGVVFLDVPGDNVQVDDRMDDLVDKFLDYITDRPHITAQTIWDAVTIEEGQETYGDAVYRTITFGGLNVSILEPRD
jgi:hypothetical protein